MRASTAAEYVAERNKALENYDDFLKFATKYQPEILQDIQKFSRVVTFHKLRTAAHSLDMRLRTESKRWLLARGYQPWDDGDVPT